MKLNRWLESVAAAGKSLLGQRGSKSSAKDPVSRLLDDCEQLLSSRGEALGTALACTVVDGYLKLDDSQKLAFFSGLKSDFAADDLAVNAAIARFQATPSGEALYGLHDASEPRRQELFRRINMAPKGTQTVVGLRADLLKAIKTDPTLAEIDGDLRHLMRSWFNRGFLRLVEIDWRTPAHILEKLISYEAVHAMNGWDDLRRRLAPDRRCFAFFHPAMEDEPLIFVEVALTCGWADSVQQLLEGPVEPDMETTADTAIFYSISDCQRGLKGISFGNFLIKQVVMELRQQLPQLTRFATLSPIPGFSKWLQRHYTSLDSDTSTHQALVAALESARFDELHSLEANNPVVAICAHYLAEARHDDWPVDPVARFHLRNGASIGRLNWMGDTSDNGLKQSLGLMVNYCYDLVSLEQNHESYVNEQRIATERSFDRQLAGWTRLSKIA